MLSFSQRKSELQELVNVKSREIELEHAHATQYFLTSSAMSRFKVWETEKKRREKKKRSVEYQRTSQTPKWLKGERKRK